MVSGTNRGIFKWLEVFLSVAELLEQFNMDLPKMDPQEMHFNVS